MTIRRLITLGVVAVLAALVGMPIASGTTAFTIHKVDEAHAAPGPDAPVFLLALGTDDRPGLDGARSDAIHLFGINPAQHAATMLDIPRDTYVPIPGHGKDKINAAYTLGGPDLAAKTIGALVGVPITYVVTTNFAGFQRMVDDIGGLDITVPQAMDDPFSGAHFAAGPRHMVGGEVLEFSRDRHLGDGDLTRTQDQGIVILSALAKLHGQGFGTPMGTVKLLQLVLKYGHTSGMSVRDLYRFGHLALSIDPANVRNVLAPSRLGQVGPASVVFSAPPAASLFADFRDDGLLETH